MNKISLKTSAKLNLFLKINGKTQNNYHDMTMINQSVDLYDFITVTKGKNGINILDNTSIEQETNIIYKTAKLINDEIRKIDVDIKLSKNIPMQAGLGGGSGDAAGIITALDIVYDLNLSDDKKIDIAKRAGADVPFCLFGGSKCVRGIGEVIDDVLCDEFSYIIIKPRENMPTKDAFALFDKLEKSEVKADFIDEILSKKKKIDIDFVQKYFYNDFEKIMEQKFDIISQIKKDFYENDADFAMMSGSGTTVYSIYTDDNLRKRAYEKLKNKYDKIFLSSTTKQGVEIL
ncbi:4-(cytidine 5'-diphospho)-2-C-methyl-D-erythritol kinase [Peptostreptococcaceae bacterium AS15]|nr:4-(cytidine 5'-diphospho)-2-C-methyl-D-erythritol kinase [Peptostreptococcaceae bacterium AS15]